tara:strand:+ start:368 stop:616 length:249 start_codon:yes stop_codon:yes gene_type:complete
LQHHFGNGVDAPVGFLENIGHGFNIAGAGYDGPILKAQGGFRNITGRHRHGTKNMFVVKQGSCVAAQLTIHFGEAFERNKEV